MPMRFSMSLTPLEEYSRPNVPSIQWRIWSELRKQPELTKHRIELGRDLSQEALGVLVCDFQGADSNPL